MYYFYGNKRNKHTNTFISMARKIDFFSNKPLAVIMVGQSGAGKDTQADMIKEFITQYSSRKILTYSSGDHFRAQEKGGSYTAKIIKEKNSEGELLSLNWAVMHWSNFLEKQYTGEEHLMFIGSPRQIKEAAMLEETLCDDFGLRPFVVHLANVDDDTARARIIERNASKGVRNETATAEAINTKLLYYHEMVVPMMEYLEARERFAIHSFDGRQKKEKVWEDIKAGLFA